MQFYNSKWFGIVGTCQGGNKFCCTVPQCPKYGQPVARRTAYNHAEAVHEPDLPGVGAQSTDLGLEDDEGCGRCQLDNIGLLVGVTT